MLLNDLANASAEEHSRLIQFHKVGMDAEYDYAKVAKDIAEHVKQFEEDQASLPRHLTFHSSMESKRLTAAQASTDAAAVKCTFKDCTRTADYECKVCHQHAFCNECYAKNSTWLHKAYRTVRPCWSCRKTAHVSCMDMISVDKLKRPGVHKNQDHRLECHNCHGSTRQLSSTPDN